MGSSRDFNGTTDDMVASYIAAYDDIFQGGAALAAWINFDTLGENNRGAIITHITGTSSNPGQGWGFQMRNPSSNNRIQFFHMFFDGAVNFGLWYNDTNLTADTWTHVAVVYNSSSTSNNPTMYINGVADTVTEHFTPTGSEFDSFSSDGYYIGNTDNDDRTFDGELAYVHVYDATITAAQVNEIMRKPGSIRPNLLGYWPILGSDSPERDLSTTKNTAAVSGASSSADGPPVTSF
jgi:hypothetical protein